jgi:hypothetical protein
VEVKPDSCADQGCGKQQTNPAKRAYQVPHQPRTGTEPRERLSDLLLIAAVPPNGRAFSGEPSERSERPERMRGRRVRCNAMLGRFNSARIDRLIPRWILRLYTAAAPLASTTSIGQPVAER